MKLGLHNFVRPFENPLMNLLYMSKMSRWRRDNTVKGYNDWYQRNWVYDRRYNLYKDIIQQEALNSQPIDYFEFGVSGGLSFKWWLEQQTDPQSRFFGFDTFEGLPEAYGSFAKGEMAAALESLNITDPRASFYKGLFQDTLVDFLENYDNKNRKLIHLDADIFSATIFVLTQLYRFMNDGDILMFDEFVVPSHEFRAFQIFADSFYLKYDVIAAANNYLFVAIKLKELKK